MATSGRMYVGSDYRRDNLGADYHGRLPAMSKGRAWLVIARMQQEIARQQQLGIGGSVSIYDEAGRIAIHGVIDLPALAAATEAALAEAFLVEQK